MTTVIEHVRDSRTPLRADLSPADALALSCLIYVDFHALPGPRSPRGCLLREVAQASSIPSLYRYSLASHADRPLLEAAGASARFGGLRVRDAVTRLTSRPLAQFGAVTFIDEAGATYVVLRGTDASAVGWAEDARFGLDFPTDSQRWAANYLAYAAARADGPIVIVGHSKGANLALYAAAATTPPALAHVYAFDPVGFPAPVVDGGLFESIDGLMRIYVTAGSWVSPLLPLPAPATVVASRWPGPLSHNPYAWRCQKSSLAPDHRLPSRSGRFLHAGLSALLRARPTRIGINKRTGPAGGHPGPLMRAFDAHVNPPGGYLSPPPRTLTQQVVVWAGCPPCHQWGLAAH